MNKELKANFGDVNYERGNENKQDRKLKNVRGDNRHNPVAHLFAQRGFEGFELFPTQAMCLVELYTTESHIQDILLGWKHENADPTAALENALRKGLLSQLLLYTEQVVAAAAEPFSFAHNLERTTCNLGKAPNQYPVELPDLHAVDKDNNSFIYNYGSRDGDDYGRSANLLKGAIGNALTSIRSDIDALQKTILLTEQGGSFKPEDVAASIEALQSKLAQFVADERVEALRNAILGENPNGEHIGVGLGTLQSQVASVAFLIRSSADRVSGFLAEQTKPYVDDVVADNHSAQLEEMFNKLALKDWILHKDSNADGKLDRSSAKAKELSDNIEKVIADIHSRSTGSSEESKSTFFGNDIDSKKIDVDKVTKEMKKLANLQDGDEKGLLNTWIANFDTLIGSFHWVLLVLLMGMGLLRQRYVAAAGK